MKQNDRDTTNKKFLSLKPGKSTFSLKIVFVAEKKYNSILVLLRFCSIFSIFSYFLLLALIC